MSAPELFDWQHLAEITAPECPGERLIACFNPLLADKRRRKREELLVATERALTKIDHRGGSSHQDPLR